MASIATRSIEIKPNTSQVFIKTSKKALQEKKSNKKKDVLSSKQPVRKKPIQKRRNTVSESHQSSSEESSSSESSSDEESEESDCNEDTVEVKKIVPPEPTTNHTVNLTCQVCFLEKSNIVFNPCGHLFSCSLCSSELTNCAICRQEIIQKILVYYS